MEYSYDMIHTDDTLTDDAKMYSFILLSANALSLTLNNVKCFLSGKYLMCLSCDDRISNVLGVYEAHNIRYLPYFINVNLSHEIIGQPIFESMRAAHQYPDFHLFRVRDELFCGIVTLSQSEYDTAYRYWKRADEHIANHKTDGMWSCHARSDLFSILNIAESAFCGKESQEENDIVRYIKDNAVSKLSLTSLCEHFHMNRTTLTNTVNEITGMSPMAYVMEERLSQVLPDLLFTNVPIGALSERYCFSDMNYFIRVFKKKYGKSPLQYRNDGYQERLRNEKSYHRMELDSMFGNYIRTGNQRALTLLQDQHDKTQYRKILIDFYTDLIPKERKLGEYDLKLIECFDESNELIREIADKLTIQIENNKNSQAYQFLKLLKSILGEK